MKVTLRWKLSSDESYLVMKVKIGKEVKKSDGLWRFACGDVFFLGSEPFYKYLTAHKNTATESNSRN